MKFYKVKIEYLPEESSKKKTRKYILVVSSTEGIDKYPLGKLIGNMGALISFTYRRINNVRINEGVILHEFNKRISISDHSEKKYLFNNTFGPKFLETL